MASVVTSGDIGNKDAKASSSGEKKSSDRDDAMTQHIIATYKNGCESLSELVTSLRGELLKLQTGLDEKKEENKNEIEVNVDEIINKFETAGKKGEKISVDKELILKLTKKAGQIFSNEKTLLSINVSSGEELTVISSVSAHYESLISFFIKHGFPGEEKQTQIKKKYLFLGRYVNRGDRSLETLALLLCYKIKYPNDFWLLRGNHESFVIAAQYGLYRECKLNGIESQFNDICQCFDYMPLSAVVNNKIFCSSSGIPRELKDLKDIEKIERPINSIPKEGIICDLLWADPDLNNSLKNGEDYGVSDRGISFKFSENVVNRFCEKFGFDLIIRGNSVVNDGYQEFGKEKKLISLFSAPNYCGVMSNKGCVMKINENSKHSFVEM